MPPLKPVLVREGPSRLRWERTPKGWRLKDLWPSAEERRALLRESARGRRVYLRVENDALEPVVAFEEEVPALPGGVSSVPAGNGVVLLSFAPLDWLPKAARQEGMTFLTSALKMTCHAWPRLLLQPSRHLRGLTFLYAGPDLTDERVLQALERESWTHA